MIPIDEPTPPEERLPANKRLRIDLIVAAAVFAGILLVGRLISGHDGPPGPHSTSRPASLSPRLITFPAPSSVYVTRGNGEVTRVPALPLRTEADPTTCPPRISCVSAEGSPGRALAPVLDRYAGARVVTVRSIRLQDDPWSGALWYRRLTFRVNGGDLLISLLARGRDPRADNGRIGDELYLRTTLQQYEVTVQASAATGLLLPDLRRIATDERLLAT